MRKRSLLLMLVLIITGLAIGTAGLFMSRHHDSPIGGIVNMSVPIPQGSRLTEECFMRFACKVSFTTTATPEEIVSFYATVFTPPTWIRCGGGCILSGCVPIAVGYQQPDTYNKLDIVMTESDTAGWRNVSLVIPEVDSRGLVYPDITVDC